MCGIAGHMSQAFSADDSRRIAVTMANSVKHRGPDDSGVWLDEKVGVVLAHRRLAILDLSAAGHQPMVSATGRWVIVFNGEIYNHLELRKTLETSGHMVAWRGQSDTETLLACIEHWGIESAIKATIGMFALALWDRRQHTLTLARDRLGEKPLYYGCQGNTFLFGSELKAFRAHPAFRAEIDRDALAGFMCYGYVSAPKSIYRGIYKLPPGTLLTVWEGNSAGSKPIPYWSLLDVARRGLRAPFSGSDTDAIEELQARLSAAVAMQRIADVPLGAFLSGGIDSSTIVSLMQAQSSRPVRSFSIGSSHYEYNEANHARAVAQHIGTDHTELYATPVEAMAVIPRLPSFYDEPLGDSSQIPTFLISQLARQSVTVSLTGDGGDELFGGYNRHAWVRRLLKVPALARRLLAGGLTTLSPLQWEYVYVAVRGILPASLQLRMAGDKAHKLASILAGDSGADIYQRLVSIWPDADSFVSGGRALKAPSTAWDSLVDLDAPENRMMVLDATTYLPDDILCKVDRAAMAVSLETRAPFLDHRVVEFAWSLPLDMKLRDRQGKWILRQLLYKYVPKELVERPKMGFAVPIDTWLRGPLREWAESLLDEARLRREGYFNPVPIRQKWAEHLSGKRNWQYCLWNALMFQAWREATG